jgi:hypothetical protein
MHSLGNCWACPGIKDDGLGVEPFFDLCLAPALLTLPSVPCDKQPHAYSGKIGKNCCAGTHSPFKQLAWLNLRQAAMVRWRLRCTISTHATAGHCSVAHLLLVQIIQRQPQQLVDIGVVCCTTALAPLSTLCRAWGLLSEALD